jgi:hypothetical protein
MRSGIVRWSSSWGTASRLRSGTPTSWPTPTFGADGYRIEAPQELLPTLRQALAEDTVSVISCPVDYSANLELIAALGELDESPS